MKIYVIINKDNGEYLMDNRYSRNLNSMYMFTKKIEKAMKYPNEKDAEIAISIIRNIMFSIGMNYNLETSCKDNSEENIYEYECGNVTEKVKEKETDPIEKLKFLLKYSEYVDDTEVDNLMRIVEHISKGIENICRECRDMENEINKFKTERSNVIMERDGIASNMSDICEALSHKLSTVH